MDNRKQELTKLKEYIDNVDKETTFLLQNLQWDHKHLIESPAMVTCKYVAEHRVPLHSLETHEKQCFLIQQGYNKEDMLLPDSIDPDTNTVVKLGKQDIMQIINKAASLDPLFKRGSGRSEPLSAARLQLAYSADERRAIHDAVVAAAPACSDLPDLDLPSSSGTPASRAKSRAEVLAELRNMKRRRAKYRGATNTAKYSHVLRDLIKTQMELYAEAKGIFIKTEYGAKNYVSLNNAENGNNATDIVIKQERLSPDPDDTASKRHRERSRSADRRRKKREEERKDDYNKRRERNDGNKSDYRNHGSPDSRENNSKERSKKHDSQDLQNSYRESKERKRYDYGRSKPDDYYRSEGTKKGSDRHENDRTEQASTSKHCGRYNEDDRKLYRSDDKNHRDSKNYSRHESSSKDHKNRSSRDDSKNSKSERKKYDDYEKNRSDRHREEKHRRYYDHRTEIKEEKVDYYEDSNDDKKRPKY